jgi:hypothetical protein
MELFLFHFRQTGYTLKQVFLCAPAYGTVDPANLEAILSTKFNGEKVDVEQSLQIAQRQQLTRDRMDVRAKKGNYLPHVWGWHIHSRRVSMEAFAGVVKTATSIPAVRGPGSLQ